ncbi:EYxxD motif small membrane protein [Brevibacillus fulvus]|uniref:Uncharacterized protein n=1 Tax=Brevibacillus fulvus TaxID=1125967 RepID=A0A938Y0V3_9BACL|nr:EYxxD motif small membrane protein [Brevibacillus fulvus]MBM7589527.1 hypothetical protein [Brevibacillus fulvus]
MRILGPSAYEWASHNFFLAAAVVGVVVVMALFLYNRTKKGRYRQ